MLNNLLNIGQTALSNFQVGLSVTGGNVTNASTTGYSRRTVDFANNGVTVNGVGTGSTIQAILRSFNMFLERRCLEQSSASSYQNILNSNLSQVEELFNDSDSTGVSSSLDTFLTSLQSLSASSSNASSRTETIESASSLSEMLNSLNNSLDSVNSSLDSYVSSQVDTVNGLLKQIASVNKAIGGSTTASALYDQRDTLVRELATYVDVSVAYQDDGEVRVTTGEGQTLVDGVHTYSLKVEGPKSTAALSAGSGFDGKLYFEGASNDEFTVKFLTSGDTSGTSNAATYQVSLDGGKTWVTDSDGNPKVFKAGDVNNKETVDGVSIWFGTATDANTAPSTSLSAGDKFDIMPKSGVYWVTATGGEVNVTPLNGNSSANRLSGGTIAGLLAMRDQYVGSYKDTLDTLAENLIWNVNRVHSQGAGLTAMSSATGEYAVANSSQPLSNSGLYWADRLTSGNLSFALYDSATGKNLSVTALDFSSINPPGISNFDPSVHSLEDVRDAINNTYGGKLTASVTGGKLSLSAASGVQFQVAEDTTGLLAGLGINTFFSGTDASSIAVNASVAGDTSRLCAGHVNANGEVTSGDNTTALALAGLAKSSLAFANAGGTVSNTLSGYLNTLVSKVGADASSASTSATYASTLASDLETQRESASGVNLDEELTRLMQYQQNYQAAAKLIQTASDMFDVILNLK
jgi:flagellar hook-associated protein 1 FlgK